MIHLLAIRHAPVTVERIFYGQTDVPTTLDAAEAAARIEPTVAEFAPRTIWSSDAVRCREPAALLSERLGVPHRIDERVREMSYGDWEGQAWDAVPRAEIDEWMAAWETRSPPGGESVPEFTERVAAWWRDLGPGNHFLMAHAGVVHCLDVVAGGLTWEETLEQRLDFLQAKRFSRAPAPTR
ncbi:MAG: histidine phosphatase family protein [Gemmatimonadetes bacterium]|nr:histidine phosphatase family protein [Gemmatimonadota bacterium]